MKNLKLGTLVMALFMAVSVKAQKMEMKNIESTIIGFAKAADESDAYKLATYLDDNFQVVMNRLFGSKEVSLFSKDVYLEKIRTKVFGGDNREIDVKIIVINGTTACAHVSMKSEKMTFVSLLSLIQAENGKWKIISDMPVVQ